MTSQKETRRVCSRIPCILVFKAQFWIDIKNFLLFKRVWIVFGRKISSIVQDLPSENESNMATFQAIYITYV